MWLMIAFDNKSMIGETTTTTMRPVQVYQCMTDGIGDMKA
jgi:hypothetical protein